MKIQLDLKLSKMGYKTKELYSKILVDMIAPNYFAVIKEAKYCEGLEELADKYRASIERQLFAKDIKDYNVAKAESVFGIVRHFPDEKTATKWLKAKINENFSLTYGVD